MTQELPPRPWSVNQQAPFIVDANGRYIGTPSTEHSDRALARLWAAAPELAEALEAALAELRRYEGGAAPADQAVLLQAEAALARARGEAVADAHA